MNDFKFGDIIENGWASDDNPTKRGVFIRYMHRSGRMNPGKHAVVRFDSGGLGEFPVDKEAKLTKVGTIFEVAAEAGWNACRRQVYLLSEDYIERTHPLKGNDTVEGNFYRGQYDVAKSFAKAFSAFEALDCDYFKQIDFAALSRLDAGEVCVPEVQAQKPLRVSDAENAEAGARAVSDLIDRLDAAADQSFAAAVSDMSTDNLLRLRAAIDAALPPQKKTLITHPSDNLQSGEERK